VVENLEIKIISFSLNFSKPPKLDPVEFKNKGATKNDFNNYFCCFDPLVAPFSVV
jgi:hypothetical protein